MEATVCPRCRKATATPGWCDACQRRTEPKADYRIERRSSSRLPRRWMVKRRFLHTTAALMSLVVPGAGQVYKGRVAAGIVWFVIIVAAYAFLGWPALLIHLMCVVTAGSAAPEVSRPFLYDGSWEKR